MRLSPHCAQALLKPHCDPNADQLSKKSLQIWQRRSKSGDQKSPEGLLHKWQTTGTERHWLLKLKKGTQYRILEKLAETTLDSSMGCFRVSNGSNGLLIRVYSTQSN